MSTAPLWVIFHALVGPRPRWPGRAPTKLATLRHYNRQRRIHKARVRRLSAVVEQLTALRTLGYKSNIYYARWQLQLAMQTSHCSRVRARRALEAWLASDERRGQGDT